MRQMKIKRKNIKCDCCPLSFKTKSGQKRHQLKVHEVSISCDKCIDIFISTHSYNDHLRKTHPLKRVARKDRAKNYTRKKYPKKKVVCTECPLGFKTKSILRRHKLKVHEVPMSCDKCHKLFSSNTSYNDHILTNHPYHRCSICDIVTHSKSALNHHIESQHQNKKSCLDCGLMFKSKTALKGHVNRIHSDNEIMKCSACDFQRPTKAQLKAHFKKRHTDDGKGTCQYCGEVFKGLKEHLQRTGCGGEIAKADEIPCVQCLKKFTSRNGLNRHLKEIHSGVKDKQCENCSYSTYSGFNLRLHISKMH